MQVRFRSWEKENGQTNAEFARGFSAHYKQWLTALEVTTFDELCDLMILEQFKNTIPERIVIYRTERKMTTAHLILQYICLKKDRP